jgi:sugar transferase (PEP-CTERM/EpsH1 system associated)
MAPLALNVPAMRHVLEFDDFDSGKWTVMARASRSPLRWIFALEGRRLARRERQWLEQAEASVVVNEREVSCITDASLQARLHVIEAAIPLDEPWRTDETFMPLPLPAEPMVTFIGAMDYAPNVEAVGWFARHVWPRIVTKRPDADFWIVGRSPTRKVRRLADGRRIHVSGTVPEIRPWLEQSRVVIAPVRMARGVQIKVLMAMAAGRPCVVSSGVADGIAARDGRDWLVADEPENFSRAVLDLLGNDAQATRLGQAAWSFVRKHHRAADGCRKLERLLLGTDAEDVPVTFNVAAPALCAV